MMQAVSGVLPFSGVRSLGNPAQPSSGSLPLHDLDFTSRELKGITINSLALPYTVHAEAHAVPELMTLKAELNAWHLETITARQGSGWPRHFVGRGPAPTGWNTIVTPRRFPARTWDKVRFAFDPWRPDAGSDLDGSSCIRVTGALYVDAAHGDGIAPANPPAWERAFRGHGGWMEIHPPDWIERIPCAPRIKTPIAVRLHAADASMAFHTQRLSPFQPRANPTDTLAYEEYVDGRFSNGGVRHSVNKAPDGMSVTMEVLNPQGTFKSTYLVWWQPVGR
jgi:hypothetical protein